MNKTILITFSYWILAVIIIAMILLSLGYPFALGLLMGSLFLPGTFLVKYLLPKIFKEESKKKTANTIFLFIAVAVLEFLLIISVHIWISDQAYPSIAGVLVNPMFVAVVITLLCLGDWFLSRYLSSILPEDKTITFISDRHKVSILPAEIMYVESNDREVSVYAVDGRVYRNKTGISQWENILGDDFIRVHRSFVVRKEVIRDVTPDAVTLIDGTSIPVSRKYRGVVSSTM
ncbi:MAG: LytTR family transcriptional regulator DNA-binding domain-containing protein [Bacteroidales bacterium]|nr:LytTR family transcriptional regulator DNA-binding domain-containing protein [Bacteroidales bacterium]